MKRVVFFVLSITSMTLTVGGILRAQHIAYSSTYQGVFANGSMKKCTKLADHVMPVAETSQHGITIKSIVCESDNGILNVSFELECQGNVTLQTFVSTDAGATWELIEAQSIGLFQSGNFTLSFGDWKPIIKGQVNFQCKIEALPRYYIGMSNEEGSDFDVALPIELQDVQESPDSEYVFTYAEFMPDMTAFRASVAENLIYPSTAKDFGTEGTVYVRFIVEKTGEITNVRAMNSLEGEGGPALVLAAEQAIRMIGSYEPARQNGNPIRLERTLPISFTLTDEENEKPKK